MSRVGKSQTNCCVYGCHSVAHKMPHLAFHLFPKPRESKVFVTNRFGRRELLDRHKAWANAIRTGKPVSKYMRICSLHFKLDDYYPLSDKQSKRKLLKKTAVPSCNLPKLKSQRHDSDNYRHRQYRKRNVSDEIIKEQTEHQAERGSHTDVSNAEIIVDLEKTAAEALLLLLNKPTESSPYKDVGVQVTSGDIYRPFVSLINTNQKLNTMTGLPSKALLQTLVVIVEEISPRQRPTKLNVEECIVLTLMKLKLDISYVVLEILFQTVTSETCKMIFFKTIRQLSGILKTVIVWPSSTECLKNLPICFKDFSNVRVVLDCTEIPLQVPKCLCCRLRTYSHYKSRNTVKFLTGVTPSSLISFISVAYGGRTSDKAIFEQSDLIKKMDMFCDAIMVDKGFKIEELCRSYAIKIIQPPFLKNKKQFSEEEALINAKIAKARVHIERSNQRIKVFKLLTNKLPWNLLPIINEIFTVVCGITNLSAPILADDKFMK